MSKIGPLIDLESKELEYNQSNDRDDDFAELGNLVEFSKGLTIPQLITERQDGVTLKHKIDPARTTSNGYGNIRAATNLNDANTRDASTFKLTNCILIEEVPSTVDDAQFKLALSCFGEASLVSMKTVPNETNSCIAKFKNVDSYKRAVSRGKILVGSLHLPIRPLLSVPIRICNISEMTDEAEIHSRCRFYGPLEGITRTKEDSIDVFFMVKDELDLQCILDKLNATIIDDSQWFAQLQPIIEIKKFDDGGDVHHDLNLQISSCLEDLKTELIVKKLCAADLEYLHCSIDHLELHPENQRK